MNQLISIDDSDLDQVSGGGPIATTIGNVAGTVIGGLGRLEDKADQVIGHALGFVGQVVSHIPVPVIGFRSLGSLFG